MPDSPTPEDFSADMQDSEHRALGTLLGLFVDEEESQPGRATNPRETQEYGEQFGQMLENAGDIQTAVGWEPPKSMPEPVMKEKGKFTGTERPEPHGEA